MDPSKLALCILLKHYCNESIPPDWVDKKNFEDEVCNILTNSSDQLLPKTQEKLACEVQKQFDVGMDQAKSAIRWACKYKGLFQIYVSVDNYPAFRCMLIVYVTTNILTRSGRMGTLPRVYDKTVVRRFSDIKRHGVMNHIGCILKRFYVCTAELVKDLRTTFPILFQSLVTYLLGELKKITTPDALFDSLESLQV